MNTYTKQRERRAFESGEERRERLNRRNERDRARRANETEEQKEERLRKRRERDRARKRKKSQVGLQEEVSTNENFIEPHTMSPVITPMRKRQHSDNGASTPATLQQKRQRLATEEEECRSLRLEHLRASHSEMMEVETQEQKEYRLKHASNLKHLTLPMETEEERELRLEYMSQLQHLRLSTESENDREARLEHMSHLQQMRLSTETKEAREARLEKTATAAQQKRKQVEIQWDGHLPQLEQEHVQAAMRAFHQDMATLESPMCTTCMKKFPGLKVSARTSECLRCSRDKHVPKLFSAEIGRAHV